MYNYYTNLKREEDERNERISTEKNRKTQVKRKIDQNELIQSYENRIKGFVFQMANHPLKIEDSQKIIFSSRKEYLEEEKCKIIGSKGFVFKKFKTEKQRLEEYLNEKDTIYSKQNILQINSEHNTSRTINKSNNMSRSELYLNPPEITQPSMRFKARTDLERIVDTVNMNNYGRANYEIINKQLRNLELNVSKKNHLEESQKQNIPDYASSTVKRLENQMQSEKQKQIKKNNENSEKKRKPAKKIIDNSQARYLLSDLHIKTHFKGAAGYMLFGDTSLLNSSYFKNKTTNKDINKNIENLNTSKKINNPIRNTFISNTITNKFYSKTNNNTEDEYSNSNKKFYLKTESEILKTSLAKKNSTLKFNFSQTNRGNFTQNSTNLMSLTSGNNIFKDPEISQDFLVSNPLLYNLNMNPFKKKSDSDENVDLSKLQYIKNLAFAPKYEGLSGKKVYNFKTAGFNKKLSTTMHKKKINSISDQKKDDSDTIFSNNQLTFLPKFGDFNLADYDKKNEEEKIVIEGEEFLKTDIDKITKKVLTGCNFVHKKNKNNNVTLKSGDGKLMFTGGMSVKDFRTKFNLLK